MGEARRNFFLYSGSVVEQARTGVNPLESMLLNVLAAQAWEEASAMTAAEQTGGLVDHTYP